MSQNHVIKSISLMRGVQKVECIRISNGNQ